MLVIPISGQQHVSGPAAISGDPKMADSPDVVTIGTRMAPGLGLLGYVNNLPVGSSGPLYIIVYHSISLWWQIHHVFLGRQTWMTEIKSSKDLKDQPQNPFL